MHDTIRVLMTQVIDYAGLFPPAGLDMKTSVGNWAEYAQGEQAWVLGRLIIPTSRIDEFEQTLVESELAPAPGENAWHISAIIKPGELNAQIDRIFAFNQAHAPAGTDTPPSATAESAEDGELSLPGDGGGVVIDAVEVKVSSAAEIDSAMRVIPEQLEPYFEIPVDRDVRGLITAMAGSGARAKIRTGGVEPAGIPAPGEVTRFIAACSAADVAFKATAGLHHPIRGEYPLTYDDDAPVGTMFGFFNVFLAAAFIRVLRLEPDDALAVLTETDPGRFVFCDDTVAWRSHSITTAQLARVRESFAMSFGSCSFHEPLVELDGLKLLH